jgi:hypothetical protein
LVVDAIMARMAAERVQSGGSVGSLASLVGAYTRRVTPAILDQHRTGSVSSALGVWLLLAACAPAAVASERAELEEALGCPADEASRLLARFMDAPPTPLRTAIALWVAVDDASPEVAAWTRGVPGQVESGFMPTQAQADAWAERETLGLIRKFPMDIDELTRIVLASALATKVSWEVPFGVVAAADHCAPGSAWRSAVSRLLWDGDPEGHAMIARTAAAGLVAVHAALAREGLTVISVSAAPEVDRVAVFAAAYEVADEVCREWRRRASSLWDLPLGAGHSWEISEREVPVFVAEPRLERVAGVALPAWRAEGDLDLRRSPTFGTGPALETLRQLIGPRPDDRCEATQAAVAAFTRYGFQAAAVTALGIRAAAARRPRGRAVERSAVLRFDHPYAAVAIAGRPSREGGSSSEFAGLPLFSAWVQQPIEPEDQPPAP